jgi:hypothetical protein
MNGFGSFTTTGEPQATFGDGATGARLSREEIDRCIARAHRLRAEELHQWGRRVSRTFASLFRRHARMIPDDARGKPMQPAPQV